MRHPELKSRWSWGNTGRNPIDPLHVYREKHFKTSHGGIGGDPAPTATEQEVRHKGVVYKTKSYGVGADMSCVTEQGKARVKLCESESIQANRWITSNAKSLGVPFE